MIIDGIKIAEKIYGTLLTNNSNKGLAVVLIGDDASSLVYTKQKKKACQRFGIYYNLTQLSADSDQQAVIKLIKRLNNNPRITSIVVQLPLPNQIDTDKILAAIAPEKNVEKISPAAEAIIAVLDEIEPQWPNKKICLVGCGRLVGQPLAKLMIARNANFLTICDIKTQNIPAYTKRADILILATGQQEWFDESMAKNQSIVIDAGLGEIKDEHILSQKCRAISSRRGGLGPVTVAKLMEKIILL